MRPQPEIVLSKDQRRIVWRLRQFGPCARTELALSLGLNNAALTRRSRELITLGLVEEADQDDRATRGRPTTPLRISGRGGYAVGATVHPGWLEIAVVDFAGQTLERASTPFDSADPEVFIQALERKLRELGGSGERLRSRLLGVGVAVPGPNLAGVPDRRWTVDWLADWRGVDLAQTFSDHLGLPVWIENDATAAALAEYYSGDLFRVSPSALVFFIGHGVGGGVIIDRKIFAGDHGNAGEVGRLFPGTQPRPSGIDLLNALKAAGAETDSLLDLDTHIDAYSDLVEAWMDRVADQLGQAVASGVAWLDPGAVVISGALPLRLLEGLTTRLAQGRWSIEHEHLPAPRLLASTLGSAAVAIGAALLPIHQILTPDEATE